MIVFVQTQHQTPMALLFLLLAWRRVSCTPKIVVSRSHKPMLYIHAVGYSFSAYENQRQRAVPPSSCTANEAVKEGPSVLCHKEPSSFPDQSS
ncbi:uncharacterized protein LY79DRAFT_536085 [Colletotrichum navitas]|uniref:Secreted protein n=1 Tax=Colletotrichum navitas TaxID=681940 RepID=A0AAD8QBU2_9PEZI|nr:uncharacterized protein LY79DRAFT_536085 [Colletotrichum navitas]KAK1599783.1 hypothetical protein LY79DRAFT_536085 [Colletotrichum navitas]